jgi:hypothetical protein
MEINADFVMGMCAGALVGMVLILALCDLGRSSRRQAHEPLASPAPQQVHPGRQWTGEIPLPNGPWRVIGPDGPGPALPASMLDDLALPHAGSRIDLNVHQLDGERVSRVVDGLLRDGHFDDVLARESAQRQAPGSGQRVPDNIVDFASARERVLARRERTGRAS